MIEHTVPWNTDPCTTIISHPQLGHAGSGRVAVCMIQSMTIQLLHCTMHEELASLTHHIPTTPTGDLEGKTSIIAGEIAGSNLHP